MKKKILYLGHEEVQRMQGYEPKKSEPKVQLFRRSRELGTKFPAVKVVRTKTGIYQLKNGSGDSESENKRKENFGGHYRTLAYLTPGPPLKIRVVEKHGHIEEDEEFIPLQEIKLTPYEELTLSALESLIDSLTEFKERHTIEQAAQFIQDHHLPRELLFTEVNEAEKLLSP